MKIMNIRIRPTGVLAEIGGVPSGEDAAASLVLCLRSFGIDTAYNSAIATVAAVRVDCEQPVGFAVGVGIMACWGARQGFVVRVDEELGMDEGWKLVQENGEVVWRPEP